MRKILPYILFCLFAQAATGQKIIVEIPEIYQGRYVSAAIALSEATKLTEKEMALFEVREGKNYPVAFQVVRDSKPVLYWRVAPLEKPVSKRVFIIRKGKAATSEDMMKATKLNGALIIQSGNKNLLSYQYEMVYPPKGVDTAYKRNGFIHPLWSPHGQVLTRIQPPDHYHHYGIWNPWTHVLYKNDTVDFWNIGGKKGTVRFAGFNQVSQGPVFSGYDVKHDHVVFTKDGGEEVALKEVQSVRVYAPEPESDYYVVDMVISYQCATSNPVLLLTYRYGGLGWRTTEKWDRNNSEVLTSEGKTRKDADGSKATWCIVQGAIDNDTAGVVMMSHPSNYNHPEPLRIWPETQNNRGDMFANFDPTKDKDWLLEPGKTYVLRYRLLVFNGRYTKEKAAAAYEEYIHPQLIKLSLQ
jgi:hypothetical protein